MKTWVWVLLGSLAVSALAQETVSEQTVSNRSSKKLGMYLAVNDPAPSILAVNLAYNPTDFLRVTAGFGKISTSMSMSDGSGNSVTLAEASTTTYGVGVTGMVPGWNLSPLVGLHFAGVSYSGSGAVSVGGFEQSGTHFYGSLGADWQFGSGLDLSAGYNYSFKSGIGGSVFVAAGWFVDWLG